MTKAFLCLSAAVALTAATVPYLRAASQPPTAWKGGVGLWQTPTNWTTGVPGFSSTTSIDGGQTTVSSLVTLIGAGAARGITIDAGDQLLIGGPTPSDTATLTCQDITLNGIISPGNGQQDTLSMSGNLTNNGSIFANNDSIFLINVSLYFVNNGLIDVSENPGDVLADAEFNSTNIPGGMNITGSGNISIHDGGTLSFDHAVNINSTGFINVNSSPGLFIDAPSNITIAGLTGTGTINASGGLSQITLNSPAASVSSFSGSLAGNVSVSKYGAGTQILGGNNTYLGTTDLCAGTLQVDGNAGFGNMTVHAGGTFAGTGSTRCFVTIASGGTVSPGDNGGLSPGTLTAGITLLLQSGSTLQLDISNSPSNSDRLNISDGEFEASNVNVHLVPHGLLTWHQTYTLINWAGAISLDGITASAFNLLPSGVNGTFVIDNTADTVSFFVTADAGDANQDGIVNLSDLNIVLNNLGRTGSQWTNGNFDGAPTVDLSDLQTVLSNLGVSSIALSGPQPSVSTPEPATLLLLTAALPMIGTRRRQKSP